MSRMYFILSILVISVCFFSICLIGAEPLEEKDIYTPLYFEVEATAYCYGGTRCDGGPVRKGICAGKKEWYGKVIALYEQGVDGELGGFIGYYECLDTGGDYRIKEGKCVDIYMSSYEDCINFGRKKCFAVILDGKG